jgi:DNA-binding MarR family transcriptional regulator
MTNATLGTLLRHLLALLDGDVEATYRSAGLDYRPRFTPVMRHLEETGVSSIRSIADATGITHSAASQTVAEMVKKGLVVAEQGEDARERMIEFTARGAALLPLLRVFWSATNKAADELSEEIGLPLPETLMKAIAALEARPFRNRIGNHLSQKAARSVPAKRAASSAGKRGTSRKVAS